MSEGLIWGVTFAFSTLGGIGGLILLHRSALKIALSRAELSNLEEIKHLKDAADHAATTLRKTMERLDATDARQRALEIELAPYQANNAGLRQRLADMKATWLNYEESEKNCHKLLERNLWVLLPDHAVERDFLSERGVVNAFEDHFGEKNGDWIGGKDHLDKESWRIRVGPTSRPDLFGNANTEGNFDEPNKVYLIIELKAPGLTICWDHIEQVHAYALSLMMNVGNRLRKKRIDCLVVGKDLAEGVNDAHLRWGKEAHHAIRIVPMTYRQLYERACRIAGPFKDRAFKDIGAAIPPIDQLSTAVPADTEEQPEAA